METLGVVGESLGCGIAPLYCLEWPYKILKCRPREGPTLGYISNSCDSPQDFLHMLIRMVTATVEVFRQFGEFLLRGALCLYCLAWPYKTPNYRAREGPASGLRTKLLLCSQSFVYWAGWMWQTTECLILYVVFSLGAVMWLPFWEYRCEAKNLKCRQSAFLPLKCPKTHWRMLLNGKDRCLISLEDFKWGESTLESERHFKHSHIVDIWTLWVAWSRSLGYSLCWITESQSYCINQKAWIPYCVIIQEVGCQFVKPIRTDDGKNCDIFCNWFHLCACTNEPSGEDLCTRCVVQN